MDVAPKGRNGFLLFLPSRLLALELLQLGMHVWKNALTKIPFGAMRGRRRLRIDIEAARDAFNAETPRDVAILY
jgi:hypothetical protein